MSEGVKVKMYFLHDDDRSDIVKDILDSKALLLGTPTLFNGPYPSLGDILFYLEGLSFQRTGIKRIAATFGSKGWSGKAVNKVAEGLEKSGFEVLEKYEVNYQPTEEELDHCYKIGKQMALKIKQMGEK